MYSICLLTNNLANVVTIEEFLKETQNNLVKLNDMGVFPCTGHWVHIDKEYGFEESAAESLLTAPRWHGFKVRIPMPTKGAEAALAEIEKISGLCVHDPDNDSSYYGFKLNVRMYVPKDFVAFANGVLCIPEIIIETR